MKPLNQDAIEVLKGRAEGVCIKGEWKWLIESRHVGRYVKLLERRGLIKCSYYAGGSAGAWPTDAGREALKEYA